MYGQPPWWCLLRQKIKCLDIHHLWARVPTCKCEQTSMRRGETGARGGECNTKKMWQPPPNPQKCQEKKQKAAFLSRKVREPRAEANTRRRSGNSLDTSAHSPHLGGGGGREEGEGGEETRDESLSSLHPFSGHGRPSHKALFCLPAYLFLQKLFIT